MKNNSLVITILVAVIVGGAAFFGGMQYQKMQTPSFGGGRFARGVSGQNGQFGARAGMRPVSGEILSVDTTGITVKMPDGSSKIVILSNSTTINKASEGSKSDLKTGEQVTVFGTTNSDGSVTAQNVSLGNGMRMFQRTVTVSPAPSK